MKWDGMREVDRCNDEKCSGYMKGTDNKPSSDPS